MVVKIFGRLLIAAILYLAVSTLVFFSGFMLFRNGVIVDVPWIFSVQRNLYVGGGWHVWQAQSECVDFDERLIYKPKVGPCRFINTEFDTVLNFDENGRKMSDITPSGKSIAVIGDSFAMGWGVGDMETYASELQQRTGRKVYNLAVSSYGTVRELMRLEDSRLLDGIDTVIIQYCNNDLDENISFKVPSLADARRTFSTITEPKPSDRLSYLKYLYRSYKFASGYPLSEIRRKVFQRNELEDFTPHYGPLMNSIRKMDALRDKKVVVIYNNSWGRKFRNFPAGKDKEMKNVIFVDLEFDREDHYLLDSHLNKRGHKTVGRQLAEVLKTF